MDHFLRDQCHSALFLWSQHQVKRETSKKIEILLSVLVLAFSFLSFTHSEASLQVSDAILWRIKTALKEKGLNWYKQGVSDDGWEMINEHRRQQKAQAVLFIMKTWSSINISHMCSLTGWIMSKRQEFWSTFPNIVKSGEHTSFPQLSHSYGFFLFLTVWQF